MSEKTPQERHAERRDELEMLLIRETVSLAAVAAIMIVLSPGVQQWLRHQAWRLRRLHRADAEQVETALAGLRRELSRDLPLVERGLVDP